MVVIVAVYSKKIGLPAYSSHSYSVSLTSEVAEIGQVERESAKLYSILQQSVDREMQEPGFVPDGNGHGSPASRSTNGPANQPNGDQWNCSDKQKDLILRIVEENKIPKQEVETLAKQLFEKPVKALNRLEASGIIENLLNQYATKKTNGGNGRGVYQRGARR